MISREVSLSPINNVRKLFTSLSSIYFPFVRNGIEMAHEPWNWNMIDRTIPSF